MIGGDRRRMLPTEVARLLNSTPLGVVTRGARVRSHVEQAGFRVGDGRTVDLLRYAAWLADRRHGVVSTPPVDRGMDATAEYAGKREAMAARSNRVSRFGRDIGAIPPVANEARRRRCSRDLRRFCESYLASVFTMAWSDDHRKALAKIQGAVLDGGLFAFAMPRGSGKTTIVEAAVVWAMLYGHRRFIALIGSAEDHAEAMLDNIKAELSTNDLLLADFPEVCVAIERLEGIAQRANGQLCEGLRTHIEWSSKTLVLPTIAGSPASGGVIRVAGLTGQIRGMSFRRPDGSKVRPDFVAIDDPQTDESARSPSQCRQREAIISGAVLGLAGPGCEISGFLPCTVVQRGDLADSMLDRKRHPEWQGERFKLVYEWPRDVALWEEYARLRRESLANDGRGEPATKHYRKHRRRMDLGARIAWPRRHKPDELSAIQHAWNLRIDRGDAAFFSEYQNEPIPETTTDEGSLTASEIAARVDGVPRGVVPDECQHLTQFIDVQGSLLYWIVVAWTETFTGHVVDYGSWPEQPGRGLGLRGARRTLQQALPKAGQEAQVRHGLDRLVAETLGREWRREDGATMRIRRCLVDANWGTLTDEVYAFCRRSVHAATLMPCHGRFVGASSRPWAEYTRKPGDRIGQRWRIPAPTGRRAIRYVLFDANWWKSFVSERWRVAIGDPGALTLPGRDGREHEGYADQLVSERGIEVQAQGRTVIEWKLKAPGLDNHMLDCTVGAAVAASLEGAAISGDGPPRARRRLRLSEIQAAKRQRQ